MRYQLQGRYPDYNPDLPGILKANEYVEKNLITMAQREIIKILKQYISILRSEGIIIDKAFLYGSYLTNTATDDSDNDIMTVTDNGNDYVAGKIWTLTKKVNSGIEPFIVEYPYPSLKFPTF